jgi:hypothetical protein
MNVYLYFTAMEVDYPETINGVCVKVEPRSPTTVIRPGSRYDDFSSCDICVLISSENAGDDDFLLALKADDWTCSEKSDGD